MTQQWPSPTCPPPAPPLRLSPRTLLQTSRSPARPTTTAPAGEGSSPCGQHQEVFRESFVRIPTPLYTEVSPLWGFWVKNTGTPYPSVSILNPTYKVEEGGGHKKPQWSAPREAETSLWEEALGSRATFQERRGREMWCGLSNHAALTLLPTPRVSLIIPLRVLSQRPHKIKLFPKSLVQSRRSLWLGSYHISVWPKMTFWSTWWSGLFLPQIGNFCMQ